MVDPVEPTEAASAGEGKPSGDFHPLTEAELAARHKRNLAVALAVVAFCVIVFSITILRLYQNTSGAS